MTFARALLFSFLLIDSCIAQEAVTEQRVFEDLVYLMTAGGASSQMVFISRDEPPGYTWNTEYSVAVCGKFPIVHIGPEPWDDPELMTKVVAHEAAHLMICDRYGHMKPDPHDVEWLELNQLFLTLLRKSSIPSEVHQ